MNPFIENFTPNSSRARYNRRKHDDSYFSRVSYNTVEWINHQSPIEQFAYVLILIVFVIIFTAIYFIYTEHYLFQSEPLIMTNSTSILSELVMPTTKEPTPRILIRPKTTTKKILIDGYYHGHHDGHHPRIVTKLPDELTTEISPNTFTTNLVLFTGIQSTLETSIASSSTTTTTTPESSELPTTQESTSNVVIQSTTQSTIQHMTQATSTILIQTTTQLTTQPTTQLSTQSSKQLINKSITQTTTSTILLPTVTQPLKSSLEMRPKIPTTRSTTRPTTRSTTRLTTQPTPQSTQLTKKLTTQPARVQTTTSTPMELAVIRNKFNQLIDKKMRNINQSNDLIAYDSEKILLELANQMEKQNQSIDLCSFMGFNHLSVPENNADYYWFKPRECPSDNQNVWDGFDPNFNCSKFNQSKSTCKKLNQFWDSCIRKNQNLTDFKRLIENLGFNSYLPNNISGSDMNQLFKLLDYHPIFNFKPIPDHLNLNATVSLVERDDYPLFNNQNCRDADFRNEFINNQLKYLNESWDEANQELDSTLAEAFFLAKFIESVENVIPKQNSTKSSSWLRSNSIGHLNQSNFTINVNVNADYLIEYEPEYFKNTLMTINDYEPIDFYYTLLMFNLKQNLIHLDHNSKEFYHECFTNCSQLNRNNFCRNMVTLPFGLISLTDHLLRSNDNMDSNLVAVKLADQLINNLIKSMITKLSLNQLTTELIKDLCFIIFQQLAVNQIAFNTDYIDTIYNSLQVGDNYFDNVQSVRTWIRSGYKGGCLLNYASI